MHSFLPLSCGTFHTGLIPTNDKTIISPFPRWGDQQYQLAAHTQWLSCEHQYITAVGTLGLTANQAGNSSQVISNSDLKLRLNGCEARRSGTGASRRQTPDMALRRPWHAAMFVLIDTPDRDIYEWTMQRAVGGTPATKWITMLQPMKPKRRWCCQTSNSPKQIGKKHLHCSKLQVHCRQAGAPIRFLVTETHTSDNK